MNKLWDLDDYINHLSHASEYVRRWAFRALENRFPNRYIDEVGKLISEADEYFACSVLRYLAQHQAEHQAPAILEKFKNSQGNIASNAATALGRLLYEPALEVMLEQFTNPESADQFLGLLDYLGTIRHEQCREALQAAVTQIKDTFISGAAVSRLLQHYNIDDIDLVLEKYFQSGKHNQRDIKILENILSPLDGSTYFTNLTEFRGSDILEKPAQTIDDLIAKNEHISLDARLREKMIAALEKGEHESFVTMIMFDARKIVNGRYPHNSHPKFLTETFDQDTMCLGLLENLAKRSDIWKHAQAVDDGLVSFIVSAYFAILERSAYLKALDPEAEIHELISSLKNAGPRLPVPIRKKIATLSPIAELKDSLTTNLRTWGDIWTVRIMGRIGDNAFVPDLLYVLRTSDSLDYIHDEALQAASGLDESADEPLFLAIKNREIGDWASFAILEYLPYAEAYDLALERWENEDDNDMDSYEIFASCLRGIGDPRAIAKLQDIYANENDAVYVGNALECLGELHNINIPEQADIQRNRIKQQERQEAKQQEFSKLAKGILNQRKEIAPQESGSVMPYKRSTPKVGRNDPCPCGSGKKYKKCCLN